MIDPMTDVELCELEDIFELAAKAQEDGINAQPRPESQWYRAGDRGIVCLWKPQNRTETMRISHWWVDEAHRGEDIGEALLDRAVFDAENTPGIATLDIYAREPETVHEYGFEEAEGGNAGYNYTYMARSI